MSTATIFDPYEILGIACDASPEEIQKAYRYLAQEHHPDHNPDDSSAVHRFREVQRAFETLSDPEKRRDYDRSVHVENPKDRHHRSQERTHDTGLQTGRSDDVSDQTIQYRGIHTGAIVGLVLGLLSAFMIVAAGNSLDSCLMVTPIPVVGMFVSLRSWARIRRESEQFTGSRLALAGFTLSLVFLTTGLAYGGYVYATEVPDGYARISFDGMKPDEVEERGGTVVPPDIAELAGKNVFIKGYIRPDSVSVTRGIDRFLLVRDNNQCCFGDLSKIKYHDQMLVNMAGSLRVDYSQGIYRIGGVLQIQPENVAFGPGVPVFSLKADYAN